MKYSNLNKNQELSVESPLGPVLVIAGAGTGKTKVLTHRIIFLIEELSFKPHEILAITFSNKASNEMKKRIESLCHYEPIIGTYHSICLKILKEDIKYLNRGVNFNVIDDEDQISLIKDFVRAANASENSLTPRKILGVINNVKTNLLDLSNVNDPKALRTIGLSKFEDLKIIRYVKKLYDDYMVQNNLLDYDDLLILTHKLLTQEASVRTKWQERFKYILVDEFQDTNKMQFDILSLLVNPNTNNVFAVGDPDQTIYTWRGAYPYIFKDYLSKFNNIKQFILNYNYRSTKKILHVSNNVISNNVNRIPKTLSTPNDDGEKVYVYEGKSADDESNYIVSQIKKIVNSGLYSYKEIAILYRQNSLSNNIERHLIDNGIPYYVYGGTRFFQRKEIKDILAYLKLLYDDEDEISIKRVINIPKRGIGMYTIETITKYAQYNNISFGKAIKLSLDLSQDLPWKVNGIVNFFNLIKQMRSETNELSLEDKTKKIIDIIDYNEYLKNLGEDYNERTENVNELINSIALYSTENPENTIKDFIQDISLYTESNANDNSKKDTVSLMTIHVAKGSEYKVVFVIGVNEGIFPSTFNFSTASLEEERRVFYVAMTRAKERLYLTCSGGISPINKEYLSPSRFLKELGSAHVINDSNSSSRITNNDFDWFDSAKPISYADNYEEKKEEIFVGDQIVHSLFGTGVVVDKNNNFLEVIFKHPYGKKTIISNHKAILRKL